MNLKILTALFFLFAFKTFSQDLNQPYSSTATVDFSTAIIGPPTLPGYTGTIIVDASHKIHVICSDN